MVGPEVGEGAGALDRSKEAECLENWVQEGMTLGTSE